MAKERVFRITDAGGEIYAIVFIHTFDIGAHQMNCVQLRLLSRLPKGYLAGMEFWDKFSKTFVDFLETNPEDIIYFCHRDISQNLAKLRIFEYRFRQYAQTHILPLEYFVCRGVDLGGLSRHIMFAMNKSNSEFDAVKATIENNADRLVRAHEEIWSAEHSVLRY